MLHISICKYTNMSSLQYIIKNPVLCMVFLPATNADWCKQIINDSNTKSNITIGDVIFWNHEQLSEKSQTKYVESFPNLHISSIPEKFNAYKIDKTHILCLCAK